MEQSQGRPLESSRIPRPSRLPVRRDVTGTPVRSTGFDAVAPKGFLPTTRQAIQIDCDATKEGGNTKHEPVQTDQTVGLLDDVAEGQLSSSRAPSTRRRPRPSLSDRTAETLARIPSSTSPRRRRSSFFQTDGPMVSPRRPATSMARARPSTSMGLRPPLPDRWSSKKSYSPEKQRLAPTAGNSIPPRTPTKATAGTYLPHSLPPPRPRLTDAVQLTPSRPKLSLTSLRSNNHKPEFG